MRLALGLVDPYNFDVYGSEAAEANSMNEGSERDDYVQAVTAGGEAGEADQSIWAYDFPADADASASHHRQGLAAGDHVISTKQALAALSPDSFRSALVGDDFESLHRRKRRLQPSSPEQTVNPPPDPHNYYPSLPAEDAPFADHDAPLFPVALPEPSPLVPVTAPYTEATDQPLWRHLPAEPAYDEGAGDGDSDSDATAEEKGYFVDGPRPTSTYDTRKFPGLLRR